VGPLRHLKAQPVGRSFRRHPDLRGSPTRA
jgi:hypothetical protein